MGLSWRSSSSEGLDHGGFADVDVKAAVPPPMMQIVMGREREKERDK